MALPVREQLKYWGIAALVFLALLWVIGDVLLPFLVGGAIAYFLDPVVTRLQNLGLSRAIATTLITLVAVVALVLLVVWIIPRLSNQLTALVRAAPDIAQQLEAFLLEQFPDLTDSTSTIRKTLSSLGDTIQKLGTNLASSLLLSAKGIVSTAIFIVIAPVVAFYLLLDWWNMMARIDKLLPRQYAPVIRHLARDVDRVLAGFVRGQVMVCLILGTFYAVALMLAGLQFGMIIGAIAGAVTFIPYVGTVVGGTLAIGLALFQYWGDWLHIGIIAAIFVFGQFVEGNILTPKLMGRSVGLHPVWLLLALYVFGSLFGFTGMLVAVPLAAVIGVLARFAVEKYEQSELYSGGHSGGGNPPESRS